MTTAIFVLAWVWAAVVMPDQVPSHFDAAGRVDDRDSKTFMLVFWAIIAVVVLAGIPALARFATTGNGVLLNMPLRYKEYWLAPERRRDFQRRFQDDLELFTGLTGLLLSVILVLTTWVAVTGRDAAPGWALPVLVGGYLVATAVWTVALLREYRPQWTMSSEDLERVLACRP